MRTVEALAILRRMLEQATDIEQEGALEVAVQHIERELQSGTGELRGARDLLTLMAAVEQDAVLRDALTMGADALLAEARRREHAE